ncbi:uncharacterized protein OCT59_016955 [Rhizophagus irregularis]|nr:hypothetical protein GLOIN_2v1779839 [Rhizophagus irregularis DAOM 181602=DAOM 197198]EXX67884.1 hypothetical protein RirG_110170 [Rhizophagus irregularis DAOM 197198w]POG67090.1 hypothetical protein GLOIN_2v1779839 [Rhizophagus irregularis DAOM 181602=DAOM 197198]UZO24660.1 hypothetical protein OCT59_016955 [Rhizophagus irregularis]GBC14568.2 hypothetical protein GLOIN_2v1779839 [Rhizophagus irregularis DAOM 181602=DAOM 197198]|eukprot:XP_025173956.1 hypothetical protein GLOIN_2v1779839 [Rhizophagus irregularis DAOM 181602=DAOM 197198]
MDKQSKSVKHRKLSKNEFITKKYSKLRFDAVRTPKQIERWNRLTKSVFKTEHHFNMNKPYILNPTTKCTRNLVVFKQIHVPKKFICPYSMMFSPFPRSQEEIKNRQREKCHEKN